MYPPKKNGAYTAMFVRLIKENTKRKVRTTPSGVSKVQNRPSTDPL
jgi:hypothetical protein